MENALIKPVLFLISSVIMFYASIAQAMDYAAVSYAVDNAHVKIWLNGALVADEINGRGQVQVFSKQHESYQEAIAAGAPQDVVNTYFCLKEKNNVEIELSGTGYGEGKLKFGIRSKKGMAYLLNQKQDIVDENELKKINDIINVELSPSSKKYQFSF